MSSPQWVVLPSGMAELSGSYTWPSPFTYFERGAPAQPYPISPVFCSDISSGRSPPISVVFSPVLWSCSVLSRSTSARELLSVSGFQVLGSPLDFPSPGRGMSLANLEQALTPEIQLAAMHTGSNPLISCSKYGLIHLSFQGFSLFFCSILMHVKKENELFLIVFFCSLFC